jgi:SAM-dependent methyltransferase
MNVDEKRLMSDVAATIPGLDYDFLRYIGAIPEIQRRIQQHYVPFFENCTKVIDLGCGDGDFIGLLLELGIDTVGVDSDEKAFSAAKEKNLPVVCQDVLTYLEELPDNSVDGIFSAHLVEHLPYQVVLSLIQQSFRVLRPGGRLLLATPDPRTLFSHLEMFHLHYGHVSFYHPRLLCFFLQHSQFSETSFGVNPNTSSILIPEIRTIKQQRVGIESQLLDSQRWLDDLSTRRLSYNREIPLQGSSLIHQVSHKFKKWFTRMFVQPLIDDVVSNINHAHHSQIQRLTLQQQELSKQVHAIVDSVDSLNGPFECYATGIKEITADRD